MKTAGVAGLGLIGGSMAKAIRAHTDLRLYGYNRTKSVVENAIGEGTLDGELTAENAKELDILIVALMPDITVSRIREYSEHLKKGCIVVDCTGVKKVITDPLSKELNEKGIRFIGGHPMAGKEVSGYENAEAALFSNASMILCRDEYTDEEAFAEAKAFFHSIGFPRIRETTAEEHDRVIAYTSQMAHVVSNAYIRSSTLPLRYGFSAGSFKDLTRVAKLNEYMWTDLFLANREALLAELDEFMTHMSEYREALARSDAETLVSLLRDGRIRKEDDEAKEEDAFRKLM